MSSRVAPASRDLGAQRLTILAWVNENPGQSKSALADSLGFSWGATCHHLRILEARGFLRIERDGRQARIFVPDQDSRHASLSRILADPVASRVLMHCQGVPQTQVPELVQKLQLSRKVVRLRLTMLLAAGLVVKEGQGWPRFKAVKAPQWIREHLRIGPWQSNPGNLSVQGPSQVPGCPPVV